MRVRTPARTSPLRPLISSSVIRGIPSSIRPPIRHSGEGRNPEGRGEANVARGLVPRWGRGGAWQNPPRQLAVPNHNSGFSHLGAPATAGMCDCCYENGLPPLNSSFVRKHIPDSDPGCVLQSTSMPALHRRNVPNCRPMVDGGMRKCSARGLSPAGVGVGRGRIHRANSPYQITTPGFHTLVRRQQPACAIAAMKACPGLRSGIDSHPSIRHSSESWNPEGVGRGECSAGACPQLRAPLVRPRRTARLSAPLLAVSFTSSPHSLHNSLANPS